MPPPPPRSSPKKGGHLKLGLQGASATDILDPAKALVQFHLVMARNWGDTLIESDPFTGAAVPALAESWEPSADASTWTFKVRKGVQFHNGKELTAEDIVKTFERHSDAKSESGALGVVKSITGMKADGGNLVVTLSEGNADLPLLLSDYHLVIQPDGGVGNPNAAIGTGAYKLKSFEAGVRATFEKNPNDWRSDRGSCRQHRNDRHERCDGPHRGAFLGPGALHQPRRSQDGRPAEARA